MDNKCAICKRELIEGSSTDVHHWFPKATVKGVNKGPTSVLHKICHQKIHSVFTEAELSFYFHTPERILESDEIQKFVKWVSKKDLEFCDINRETKTKRNKRRK